MAVEGEEALQFMTLKAGPGLVETTAPVNPGAVEGDTDDQLVVATLNGDESAFALLFERHKRLVASAAGRFFYNREQVEEIIQTSFMQAYIALGQYKGGREWSFAAWLKRVTVTTCLDEIRRSQRRSEQLISDLNEDEANFVFERLTNETGRSNHEGLAISRDLASKLLASLSPEDRIALTLLYADEWTVAEIGELLGWSVSKVKGRAHKARQVLGKTMKRLKVS